MRRGAIFFSTASRGSISAYSSISVQYVPGVFLISALSRAAPSTLRSTAPASFARFIQYSAFSISSVVPQKFFALSAEQRGA